MKEKVIQCSEKIAEFCLYALILCIPITNAGIEIFATFGIFSFLIYKFLFFQKSGMPFHRLSLLNKILLLFIFVNALSVVFSSFFWLSFRAFFTKLLEAVLLYYLAKEMSFDHERMKRIVKVIIFILAFIGFDCLVQIITGTDFLRGRHLHKGMHLTASFFNPNNFAAWISASLPLVFVMMLQQSGERRYLWRKILFLAFLCGLIFCVGFTNSRGSWLGLSVGFIFMVISLVAVKKNWSQKKIILTALILIILTIIPFILMNPGTSSDFSIRVNEILSGRLTLWKETLGIVQEHPLLGSGLNTYTALLSRAGLQPPNILYPHNSFIHMATEIGLLGVGVEKRSRQMHPFMKVPSS